uniref:Solute binding protein-like protein (ABC.PE.S) n=1 Tax=uncultured marine thaumarchaeote SAT1000_09_A04 TaxID=1456366 RepID=A0A075I2W6_9ARCH|nr:solute binding protein-like protein (ABC.PE.S) [uncultured marine thaumarchaeote SAT1000_09_A04]
MKFWLVIILATIALPVAFAEKGTFVDQIQFIQYLDENTALEEVRNGNLDMYYFRISSDRLEAEKDRDGIQVFESTGGSYSILVNPSVSEDFNPFSISELRFALNYLVDRNLIVNELIGGYGRTMISNYGIFAADYLTIIDEIESFHFKHNPSFANQIITEELEKAGAEKIDNYWHYDGKQIEITFFIRSDDPVRKAIGEILSSELENVGFKVKKTLGILTRPLLLFMAQTLQTKSGIFILKVGAALDFQNMTLLGLHKCILPGFLTCQETMIQIIGITKMITLIPLRRKSMLEILTLPRKEAH